MAILFRVVVGTLTLSAGGFAGLALKEGYVKEAMQPNQFDRFTFGIGSTFRPGGVPVKPGDTIEPVEAIRLAVEHIAKDEAVLRACIKQPLYQAEWDVLVGHAYQFGPAVTCASPMVRQVNKGDYAAACQAYTSYRYITSPKPVDGWEPYKKNGQQRWKFDCATKGNKTCYGVWLRAVERRDMCLAAQAPAQAPVSEPVQAPVSEPVQEPVAPKRSLWPLFFGLIFAAVAGRFAYRRWKK
jgi:lysozyme